MGDIDQLVSLMESMGVAKKTDLVGVPLKEIQTLEHHLQLKFPRMYKEYLLRFGRSAGYLSPWMAIYFDDLKEIRENYDADLLSTKSGFKLPPKALLIANLDSVYDFILCGGKEDPAIYRVDLGAKQGVSCKPYAPSFSLYLDNTIKYADTTGIPEAVFEEQLNLAVDNLMTY